MVIYFKSSGHSEQGSFFTTAAVLKMYTRNTNIKLPDASVKSTKDTILTSLVSVKNC